MSVVSQLAGVPAAQAGDARQPSELLASCPCQPADESLFLVYNPGVSYSPAPDPGLSPAGLETRARQQLESVIAARDSSLLPAAQAVFNDSLLAGKIPHPSLRAGLAMLVGTFAEPLIDVYRAPFMRGALFRTPSIPSAFAETAYYFDDGSREVWFNPRDQHELPGQFAQSMAHEALHASGPILGESGRPEEATLHLVDTLVHAVMVRDQPELALVRTLASVDFSTDVLGIVFNSHSMTGARGPELFPGAGLPEVDSYYEDAPSMKDAPDVPSTGDSRLVEVINALGLADVAIDPSFDVNGDALPDYTRSLVDSLRLDRILDSGGVLSSEDLRQVATTLTIALSPPTANGPPEADAGGPYSTPEGSAIVLDGSGSTDPDGDALRFEWEPSDLLNPASSATPTFRGVDDGQVPVVLTVADDQGATGTDSTTIVVTNVPPSISAVEPEPNLPIKAGKEVAIVVTFSDPGTSDSHTVTIRPPGQQPVTVAAPPSGPTRATITFGAPGTYDVPVEVLDDDGGQAIASTTLAVAPGFDSPADVVPVVARSSLPGQSGPSNTRPPLARTGQDLMFRYTLGVVLLLLGSLLVGIGSVRLRRSSSGRS